MSAAKDEWKGRCMREIKIRCTPMDESPMDDWMDNGRLVRWIMYGLGDGWHLYM